MPVKLYESQVQQFSTIFFMCKCCFVIHFLMISFDSISQLMKGRLASTLSFFTFYHSEQVSFMNVSYLSVNKGTYEQLDLALNMHYYINVHSCFYTCEFKKHKTQLTLSGEWCRQDKDGIRFLLFIFFLFCIL